MKIEYKDKVYDVVKETAKMYYITNTKRVYKSSCKVVDGTKPVAKTEKPKAKKKVIKVVGKKEIKKYKDLKVNDKVIIVNDDEKIEGKVTFIVHEKNELKWDPYFCVNNNVNVRYVLEGGIKVYKA
jgi:hypothetical protein